MTDNVSQKSSENSQMTIEEEDLCTYWLTKIWPNYSIDFDEFKTIVKKKGVQIINSNEFIAF